MSDEKAFTDHLFVCIGRRYQYDGRLMIRLVQIIETATLAVDQSLDYEYGKNTKHLKAGMVYRMKANLEGGVTIQPRTAVPVRLYEDTEKRTEWQALDWAAKTAYDVDRQSQKESLRTDLMKALRPIRAAYFKTNVATRSGLEVLVLQVLRTPLSLEEKQRKG